MNDVGAIKTPALAFIGLCWLTACQSDQQAELDAIQQLSDRLTQMEVSLRNIEAAVAPPLPAVVEGRVGVPLERMKITKGSAGLGALKLTTHLVTLDTEPWSYDEPSRQLRIEYNYRVHDDKEVMTYCAQLEAPDNGIFGSYRFFGQGWWLFLPDGRRLTAEARNQLGAYPGAPSDQGTRCDFVLPGDVDPGDIPELKFAWVNADSVMPLWPKDEDNRMMPSVILTLGPAVNPE